jgi:hypothetical protein
MARAVPVFVLLLAFFTSACAGSAASYSNASGATKFLADTVGGARVGFDVEKVDNEMWHVTLRG